MTAGTHRGWLLRHEGDIGVCACAGVEKKGMTYRFLLCPPELSGWEFLEGERWLEVTYVPFAEAGPQLDRGNRLSIPEP